MGKVGDKARRKEVKENSGVSSQIKLIECPH